MRERKVRGVKRKTENMIKQIEENTMVFPTEFYNGYWHLHLPVAQGFISSNKTSRKVKRRCIQKLLDRTDYLKGLKPNDEHHYRVVAAIDLPSLWNSQIIIFKGECHFKDFFNRNDDFQKWIPFLDNRNIQTEWELTIQGVSATAGFKEIIVDEDDFYESEIWFVGDIK